MQVKVTLEMYYDDGFSGEPQEEIALKFKALKTQVEQSNPYPIPTLPWPRFMGISTELTKIQ